MQRTILILSYYFPPMGLSGVLRAAKTAKYLALAYDWRVIVLTATPQQYYAYDETLLQELIDVGVHIYSTPSKNQAAPGKTKPLPGFFERNIIEPILSSFNFPDSAIKWRKMALAAAKVIIHQYNVNMLMTFGPPFSNFVLTDTIADLYNIPFVLEYQESWTRGKTVDNQVRLKSSNHQKMEESLLKKTARIVVPSRIAKEQLMKNYRFLEHDDIIIMASGFDPADTDAAKGIEPKTDKFRIAHAGISDNEGGLHDFISAFARFLKEYPDAALECELCLPGLITQETKKHLDKYGLQNNIDIPGYIQHKQLFKYLAECSILLATTQSMYRIPGKVYEYLGLGKPLCIIAPEGSAACTLALDCKSAYIGTSLKQDALVSLIQEMYIAWKHNKLYKANAAFAEQFSMMHLAGDLSVALTKATRF